MKGIVKMDCGLQDWYKVKDKAALEDCKQIVEVCKGLLIYAEKYGIKNTDMYIDPQNRIYTHYPYEGLKYTKVEGKQKEYFYNYPVHSNNWSSIRIKVTGTIGLIYIKHVFENNKNFYVAVRLGGKTPVEVFYEDKMIKSQEYIKDIKKWLFNPIATTKPSKTSAKTAGK